MSGRIWGNEYRTTEICIDSYRNGVPTGRFWNPYMKESESFQSLTQLITGMERLLDDMKLPQAHTVTRSFAPPPERAQSALQARDKRPGTLATFAVRVLFRRNSSWQGSITWLEGGKEQSFRSVLELILLMDSALTASQRE